MLALAERRKGRGSELRSAAWDRAVRLASVAPQTLNVLVELARVWGWTREVEDVLWYAADKFDQQPWPLETLDQLYTIRRDTAGLRRVYAARLIRNPQDRLARNNYAMVSLLANNDLARAHNAAAELHLADPQNPVFVSTYAFSLHLLGRTKDAIEVLRGLGLDKLDDPSLALYYGLFLAMDGQTETARGYLKRAETAFMLPEESALLAQAKARL
jgi:predicted Zn-dependent protease